MKSAQFLAQLTAGLVIGILIGLAFSVTNQNASYLSYAMYKTLAGSVATVLDKSVLLFVCLFVGFYVLGSVRRLLSGFLGVAFSIVAGAGLVYGFLYTSHLLQAPFGWGTTTPWEIVDRSLYRTAWISFGLTIASVVFSVLLIELLARVYARHSDQVEADVSRFGAQSVLCSRYLMATLLAIVVIPNVGFGLFSALNRYQAKSRPNIIWIMCDSLRADHLGCYGYTRSTSPNIDRFSRGSTLYSRAVSQASLTRLSVPSFLTSIYPQSRNDRVCLADVLADHGYYTTAIVGNAQLTVEGTPYNIMRKFESWNGGPATLDVSSPAILSAALKELQTKRDKPIFMFLLFMDTHAPYRRHADYKFWQSGDSGYPSVINVDDLKPTTKKSYTSGYLGYLQSLYDSGIAFTDAHVGRLFDEMKKRGMYDNSLIVFIGDHGEEFGEHQVFFHGNDLYDHAINVPLIVKTPGQSESRRIGGVFPLIDLYPSVLQTIGIRPANRLEGRAQEFRSCAAIRDTYVFSVLNIDEAINYRSVESRGTKLIYNFATKQKELYDLRSDPGEKRNLALEQPALVASLFDTLMEKERVVTRGHAGLVAERQNTANMSQADKDKLKSLGYLQ
jgi:arylsulfatase A-like enzyme